MSGPPTLTRLLRNFVLRTHLDFTNLMDSLERTQDYQRRKDLLQFLETTRQQLVRLMVLVKWLARSSASMKRAQDMVGLLTQRDATYYNSQQFLRVLSSKLEDHMFPMWDVTTAIHVMTSGSYRLLPKMLESKVEWKRTIPAEKIAQVTSRLDDKLHIHLLTTVIPPAFSKIRVKDGIVNMTVAGEFEVGLSLRMKAQNPPHMVQLTEKDRVQWLLFDLKLLLAAELPGNEVDDNVVRDVQLKDLTQFLRYQMSLSTTPIVTLHDKLHAFCVALEMDILHLQSAKLNALFGGNLVVEYDRHQKLTLKYWRSAPPIPREGSLVEQKASDIVLSICVYSQQLAIEHDPALPEMETWTEDADEKRRADFRIYSDRINLTRLFLAVIGAHANYRVKQLYQYMRNAPPRGYEKLELVDEPVVCPPSGNGSGYVERKIKSDVGDVRIKSAGSDSTAMEDESDSRVTRISGRTFVTNLIVTMLGERQLRITVDSRDGRLSFEWMVSPKREASSFSSASSCSSSSSSSSSSSTQHFGSFVSHELIRLLGVAQTRLNDINYCSHILELLEELRLNMVLELAEEVLTSLQPKDKPQLQVTRHPALLWPKQTTPPRLCLYVRLQRDSSFFLAIRLHRSPSQTIRPTEGDSPYSVTFVPSYQASFSLLQALPKTELRAQKESFIRKETRSQGLLLSSLPPVACTVAAVLTIQFREALNLTEIFSQRQQYEPYVPLPRAMGDIPSELFIDCVRHNLWNRESLSRVLQHCENLIPKLFLRSRLLTHDPPFSPIEQGVGLSAFEIPLRLHPFLSEQADDKLTVYVQSLPSNNSLDVNPLTFSLVHPSLIVLEQVPLSSSTHGPQIAWSQVQNNTIVSLAYPKLTESCVRDVFHDLESFLTLINIAIQLKNYARQCDEVLASNLPPDFFNVLSLSLSELHLSCGTEQKMVISFHERDRRPVDKWSFGSIKLKFLPLAYPQSQFLSLEYNLSRKLMDLLRRVYWAHAATPILVRFADSLLPESLNTQPALGSKLYMYMEAVSIGSRIVELVGHSASCVRVLIDTNPFDITMLHPKKVALKRKNHGRDVWELPILNEKLTQLYVYATKAWVENNMKKGPLFGLAKDPSGSGVALIAKDSTSVPNFPVYARYFSERIGSLKCVQQRQFMRSFWNLLSSPPQALSELSLLLEAELRDNSIALWLHDFSPAHLAVDQQGLSVYFTLAVTLTGTTTRVLLPVSYCQGDISLWEVYLQRPQKRNTKQLPWRGLANFLAFLQRAPPSSVLELLD